MIPTINPIAIAPAAPTVSVTELPTIVHTIRSTGRVNTMAEMLFIISREKDWFESLREVICYQRGEAFNVLWIHDIYISFA